MSPVTVGIVGIIVLIVLFLLRMPVGFALAFAGLIGFSFLVSTEAGFGVLARDVFHIFSSYSLTVIPMFVLMGSFASASGMSKRLYDRLSEDNPERFPPQAYKFAATLNLDESMAINKSAFGELANLSKKYRFDTVLLIVPELKNVIQVDKWISDECPGKHGFFSIDLFNSLKNRFIDLKTLRVVPNGLCHFNKKGHRITAEIIKQWIVETFDFDS